MAYPPNDTTPLDRHDPRVRLAGHACLPRRSPLSACQACAEACPVDALTVAAGEGPTLTGDCTGCGACAVACPSEALRVDGFPEPEGAQHRHPPVGAVECKRVPKRAARKDAVHVPCLAGLHEADLLSLARAADHQPLELMDRGWCATCPARGDHDAAPIQDASARAHRHLAGSSIPTPVVTEDPLPDSIAYPVAMGASLRHGNSRRQLLRMLDPATHASENREALPAATADPRRRLDVPRRKRLLAEREQAGAVSAPPLPRVQIDDRCCNTGICAALCPTAALTSTDAGDGLLFDPASCIDCGLCASVCPNNAITVHAQGGIPGQLTDHRQATCRDCGRRFTPANETNTHCDACEKSRELGRAAFM